MTLYRKSGRKYKGDRLPVARAWQYPHWNSSEGGYLDALLIVFIDLIRTSEHDLHFNLCHYYSRRINYTLRGTIMYPMDQVFYLLYSWQIGYINVSWDVFTCVLFMFLIDRLVVNRVTEALYDLQRPEISHTLNETDTLTPVYDDYRYSTYQRFGIPLDDCWTTLADTATGTRPMIYGILRALVTTLDHNIYHGDIILGESLVGPSPSDHRDYYNAAVRVFKISHRYLNEFGPCCFKYKPYDTIEMAIDPPLYACTTHTRVFGTQFITIHQGEILPDYNTYYQNSASSLDMPYPVGYHAKCPRANTYRHVLRFHLLLKAYIHSFRPTDTMLASGEMALSTIDVNIVD